MRYGTIKMTKGFGAFNLDTYCSNDGSLALVGNLGSLDKKTADEIAPALQDAFDQGREAAFAELRTLIGCKKD